MYVAADESEDICHIHSSLMVGLLLYREVYCICLSSSLFPYLESALKYKKPKKMIIVRRLTSTLILVFSFLFRGHRGHPIRSLSSPDGHCSQQVQSISRSDGGSAPRDDLYSSERQGRPGHLDKPKRQIPSKDLVT